MSVLRMGYPLIFEISCDVSVFHVPGSPQVMSRMFGGRLSVTNLAKGSFNRVHLVCWFKLRRGKNKPLDSVFGWQFGFLEALFL